MSETTNQVAGANGASKKRNYGPKESVPVSIPNILKMMSEGKTRKQIGDYYGLNQPQTKALFDHPKLKGKKTTKQAANAFNIVDEGSDDIPVYVAPKKKEGAEAEGSENTSAEAAVAPTNGSAEVTQPVSTEPQPVSAVWE